MAEPSGQRVRFRRRPAQAHANKCALLKALLGVSAMAPFWYLLEIIWKTEAGFVAGQRKVARLIEDEHVRAQAGAELAGQPADGVAGLEPADHVIKGGEVDAVSGPAGRDGQGDQDCGRRLLPDSEPGRGLAGGAPALVAAEHGPRVCHGARAVVARQHTGYLNQDGIACLTRDPTAVSLPMTARAPAQPSVVDLPNSSQYGERPHPSARVRSVQRASDLV